MGIAAAPVLEAQALQANLDMVAVRKAKNEAFVQLEHTRQIHGRLIAFDAMALTMEVDGRLFTFPSNEVLRIDIQGTTWFAAHSWRHRDCGLVRHPARDSTMPRRSPRSRP
jgi:hypothetical protein